jgi:hypothetical protein
MRTAGVRGGSVIAARFVVVERWRGVRANVNSGYRGADRGGAEGRAASYAPYAGLFFMHVPGKTRRMRAYRSPGSLRGNCETVCLRSSAVARIRCCSVAWAIG